MITRFMNEKRAAALLMAGAVLGVTACGTAQGAEPVTEKAAAEYTLQADNAEETTNYTEDTVFSSDYLTVTLPDEFKGKVAGVTDSNTVSISDKECSDAGFGGFVFSLVVVKDNEVIPGGTFEKVGEVETADGKIYDVCREFPSDIQWDYTKSEEMPADYKKLSDQAQAIIENTQGNNGCTFKFGAGTKGEELYGDIIAGYETAFKEGWDANRFEEEDMSPELHALIQSEGDAAYDKMGYAYADINNDNIEDLLVGVASDDGGPTVVYDAYAMINRVPMHVACGAARNRYYALEYGGIANEFSNGANENGFNVYVVETDTGKLFLQFGAKYDAYTDEKNPWFTNTASGYDEDNYEHCTEDDYNSFLERTTSRYLTLDLKHFLGTES